jgi:hypothetical protein
MIILYVQEAVWLFQDHLPAGTWSGGHINATTVCVQCSRTCGRNLHGYLYIHNGNGCTASDDAVVTVNALPVVTADDNSVCTGSSVAVSGSPAGGTWSGGHINANTGVFNAAGLAAGTYTVTYTFTNGNGCTASDIAVVTVNALPDVTANDISDCAGSNVQLISSPAGGTWSGNYISSTGIFDGAGLAAGTYTVTYTVTQNGLYCVG